MQRLKSRSASYKWAAFCTTAIGTYMSVLGQVGMNIALPSIASHFSTDLPTVQWAVIGYAVAVSAVLLPIGRLSDMLGKKRIYI